MPYWCPKISQRECGSKFRKSDCDQKKLTYGHFCGNFLLILSLVAKSDQIVATKIPKGPLNAKYTFHSVQNASLNIMADMILEQVRDEIKSAKFLPY